MSQATRHKIDKSPVWRFSLATGRQDEKMTTISVVLSLATTRRAKVAEISHHNVKLSLLVLYSM